jgi:Zn-dependent protease
MTAHSLRLGRIAGIDVFVHWTFGLLLVGAFAYVGVRQGAQAAAEWTGLIVAVFGSVVLHEYGHALAARRYGIGTKDITLYPVGGVARLQRIPERPLHEFIVALAGPLVNLAIVCVLATALLAMGRSLAFGGGMGFWSRLMWLNGVLVVFNLLPAFPMDGGRILRAVLATQLPYARATQVAAWIGQAMAALFALWAFTRGDLFLLLLAVIVYLGARQESEVALLKAATRGLRVQDAMSTAFTPLKPGDTLDDAVRLLLAGAEQEFAILEGEHTVGILTRKRLVQALRDRGRTALIRDVMEPPCGVVTESELLEDAFEQMQAAECKVLPVEREGRLVGLVTLENLGELLMIATAVRKAAAPTVPEKAAS